MAVRKGTSEPDFPEVESPLLRKPRQSTPLCLVVPKESCLKRWCDLRVQSELPDVPEQQEKASASPPAPDLTLPAAIPAR